MPVWGVKACPLQPSSGHEDSFQLAQGGELRSLLVKLPPPPSPAVLPFISLYEYLSQESSQEISHMIISVLETVFAEPNL